MSTKPLPERKAEPSLSSGSVSPTVPAPTREPRTENRTAFESNSWLGQICKPGKSFFPDFYSHDHIFEGTISEEQAVEMGIISSIDRRIVIRNNVLLPRAIGKWMRGELK